MQREPYPARRPKRLTDAVNFRVEPGTRERWARLARERGMTVAGAVRHAMDRFLEGEPTRCESCGAPHGLLEGAGDVDPAFGHWLAGFVDGEGCFRILYDRRYGTVMCRFSIKLRDDDEPILREIQTVLGVGLIQHEAGGLRGNPKALFAINSKADCLRLVSVFDRHPLRAKKARDYAIWRQAILEWCRVGGRWPAYAPTGTKPRILQLREQLDSTRAYPAP